MDLDLDLLPHQAEFIQDTTTRNLALIGGYGCGKTKALATKLILLSLMNLGYQGMAISPTYQMSVKNLIPEIEEQLRDFGIKYKFSKSEMVFEIYVSGKTTKLHTYSADNGNYKRMAGLNAAFFGFDEADLLDTETFLAAYNMASSRLRKGRVYQGVAVSTPEGFKGCYKFWVEAVQQNPDLCENRRLIQASTYDNPFLPPEYIEELERRYNGSPLLKSYLLGEFVNLAGNPVYWKFTKDLNITTDTIAQFPNHVLHVGIDFNKGKNATTVAVVKNNKVYFIDEFYGHKDTQALAEAIKARYPWHTQNNAIRFYPDASGFEGIQNLKRNFPEFGTDGKPNFRYSAANPRVEKRIAAVNEKFQSTSAGPEAFVNPARCPELFKGLTQQTYDKNGDPDKTSDLDHAVDAAGYTIYKNWPLTGNVVARVA